MLKAFKVTQLIRNRRLHTAPSDLNLAALKSWMATPKQLVLEDSLRPEHLTSLYVTLPTRDERVYAQPLNGTPLGYGHHLVFFHARNPETLLRADGTDADFCPPEPFTRRMWAGGRITWNGKKPLIVGRDATAKTSVQHVTTKGLETGNPMVFVNQKIDITMNGETEPSLHEERTHVYLPNRERAADAKARPISDLPTSVDFSYKYTPTPTTLFRFSALTFNGHYIHLDKEYAQKVEGYTERLVHGPLTALMLLEALVYHNPTATIKAFDYRARNPLMVNNPLTIYGAWKDQANVKLWCVDQNGTVGMTGIAELETDDNLQ
ncbi:hypothetical protein HGRIS_013015 [Hohenbuehelia grisea]|uniref:Mesaconyl-C(4)-CoA hydratase n=1 Tax=Hohenbuehelia grisea TaxID=104357 RepID=A0ABR3IU72_9AGAR